MSRLRVLVDQAGTPVAEVVDDAVLEALYASPGTPWLRANMIATVDGAATGNDGLSGSINNETDKRVFDVLRRLADAVMVGAGTLRLEGYTPIEKPLVVVTRQGLVPDRLRGAGAGRVLMATCAEAPHLEDARKALGTEAVLVAGDATVDLRRIVSDLGERGLTDLLTEGGPSLLTALLAEGLVDELCLTTSPALVGGDPPRIVSGGPVDVELDLRLLLEEDGTTLARWFVRR